MTDPVTGRRRVLAGVAGAAGMMAAVTVLSRAVGFVRWFVQSATLGDSATANAYSTANTLPNVLFEVAAGGALAGAVVPLLAAPLARSLRGEVDRIASALLTWTLAVLVPLGLLVALLAGPIVGLLPDSVGSDVETQRQLATFFLRIFALQIPLYGVGVVLTGVLQAQRRFLLPAIAPLLSSVVVIGAYLAFGMLSGGMADEPERLAQSALDWLAWGTTLGVAAMSLPLLVPVVRSGVRLRPVLRFPPGVGRRAVNLAAAGIGALLAQQVSVVVFIVLARAGGVEGTITIWEYSRAVYFLPYAVLAVPVATAVFPRLAELAGGHDRAAFAAMAVGSTRSVLAASLVGAGILTAVAPGVTTVFSLSGTMEGMTTAVTWLAPAVVGYGLVFHVSRCLYTLDRGRAAVMATAAGWLVVSVAAAVLVQVTAPDGGNGPATLFSLALATSIGMTVAGLALLWALRHALGADAPLGALVRTAAVGTVGAAAGGLAGRLVTDAVLDAVDPQLLSGLLASVAGGLCAAALGALAVVLADRTALRPARWS
ncbi:putative peptidoglycan lipid II flippase [Georgenia satyanarayanai]|uniref:Putative peptidoglycan lipid II flippase n=1 Tax=Georgenia satyanarayanai TaxID=860221 RepID=A0A2Y9BYV8_9MICO|nr:lipid II flippase MurJ [Georgenia satyanarayanai]PYF99134.1 putative peptidoglycan lipid II flippase [Georgenia satyanarayanai]SSA43252.1 putative peptidoglycan lipid II flippase [Georgenia satyanarayanai]